MIFKKSIQIFSNIFPLGGWHKNGDESKDCAWVAEWSPRCQVKGADKSLAMEHCTCACQ